MPTEKTHGIATMKLCEAFAKEGLDVELICPRRFNPIKEDPFDYYRVSKNFKINKIFHIDLVPLDRFLGPLASWISSLIFAFSIFWYILLKNLFTKDSVFFSHDHFPLFSLSFLSPNIFWDVHDFPRLKTFLHRTYYSFFLKRLRGFIVTNSWKKKELEKIFGIENKKILICPNGVDVDEFNIKDSKEECREKLGLPLNKKIVLYTGHLYSWKGVDTLAEASQFLPKDVEIYFVGGTEKDIKKFKIQNSKFKVNIIGHRPHPEIPYWQKSADVLVLPNTAKEEISKYWTSPMKMFEYMASKKPIVATDLPSQRDILNEDNALLVKPDDPKALAEGIKKILENEELAKSLTIKAYHDVQYFTWENRAKKILDLINSTLK